MRGMIANIDRRYADRSAQHTHRPGFLIHCRALIRPLTAGAALLLFVVPSNGATFRFATTSNRIYVEGGGSATLSDIKATLPNAPLDLVDPKHRVWLLRANLYITDGSTLVIHGSESGGDANVFRLQSNNSTDPGSFVSLTADWGSVDIKNTKITSWDSAVDGPDTEYQQFGRAFIHVRSRLAADGVTPLESRMDIVDSDVGYLGYEAAESYGLTWKVAGVHPDPTRSIFDYVNVYGDIIGSHIHNNYFGVYTFGAFGCNWLTNEVDHNLGYGFDPHDDSDYVLIEGNNVHDNGLGNLRNKLGGPRGLHGIIASKRCDHVVIRNNRSWGNVGNGIMLHRHCDDGLVENNQTFLNGDSGIALFDSDRATIRGNLVLSNSNAGMRLSQGCTDNLLVNNEIAFSGTNGVYFFMGTDPPEPDPVDPTISSRNRRNSIVDNLVHDCGSDGLKITDADDTVIMGNGFANNGPNLRFEASTLTHFISNSIPTNVTVKLLGSPLVETVVGFSGQPVVNLRMDQFCSGSYFEDRNNAIFDLSQSVYTIASGTGSEARSVLTLSWDQIGTNATVVMRDFYVFTQGGQVWVHPTLWDQVGDLSKAWNAHAETSSPIDYIVGDLAPGAAYSVRQNGKRLGVFTADADGRIRFQPSGRIREVDSRDVAAGLAGPRTFSTFNVRPQ